MKNYQYVTDRNDEFYIIISLKIKKLKTQKQINK